MARQSLIIDKKIVFDNKQLEKDFLFYIYILINRYLYISITIIIERLE